MRKITLGVIFLAVGLFVISPLDDMIILIPLSVYFNIPELIIIFNAVAILCLICAVYLFGAAKIIKPLRKNWKMVMISVVILIMAIYWYYYLA